jgi:hypothetical protein
MRLFYYSTTICKCYRSVHLIILQQQIFPGCMRITLPELLTCLNIAIIILWEESGSILKGILGFIAGKDFRSLLTTHSKNSFFG